MSFKRSLEYYESRIADRSLLLKRVLVEVPMQGGTDRFVCIPCGGSRVTGFTHFFDTLPEANVVYHTLLDSGENFPDLRVLPVVNAFDEQKFYVKWGIEEPDRKLFRGHRWDWEVAIAKQLGYNEECMEAHFERYQKFYGLGISRT